jgi:arsenite methyltransferase
MGTDKSGADYGLDAPGIAHNLFRGAGAAAIVLVARFFGLWNNHSVLAWLFFSIMGFGAGCLLAGWGMIWYSRIGKLRGREQLFDALALRGDERVLDIGCGRGLLLIAAARRLTSGRALGIDIWNTQDLSDNAADQTWANARAEGVADRVELITGDARSLPFENESFDLIVSSAALHNIYDARQREGAILEIARVLKPGGRVAISDIRHIGQYAQVLLSHGVEAQRIRSWLARLVCVWTFGSLMPGRVLGAKPKSNLPTASAPALQDSAI